MFASKEKLEEQRLNSVEKEVRQLRGELLDPDRGILPKMLVQSTEHNHRMTKMENWRSYILGSVATLGFLVVAIAVPLLIEMIKIGRL